jgi:hypothetical protein
METGLRRSYALIGLSLSLLAGLPLAGVALAGKPIRRYLEFPPRTQYVEHASFSWLAWAMVALAVIACCLPWLVRVLRAQDLGGQPPTARRFRFPWWGVAGVLLSALSWVLAWQRFAWFSTWQHHTFLPLWLGYILSINGLTYWRSGQCLLTNRTGYFLLLFPLSAGFWWYFEYLNRFVQNWYYNGVSLFTPAEYALLATLSFSTVLPAVLSTRDFLTTFPRLHAGLNCGPSVNIRRPRRLATVVLSLGCAGLLAVGLWPDYLFPLLWLAPLIVVAGLQALTGQPTVFAGTARGDWRAVGQLALAALCCGFFWELWNLHSAAKWIYTVPFVNRFHVFEMPIVGYAGYLPFGLECQAIADLFLARRK